MTDIDTQPDEEDDEPYTDYVPRWPIPTPTPADIEAVLASIQAGTHIYTDWLALVRIDDKESIEEETRIGNGLFWAELIDPTNLVDDDHLGCGNSPAEAAATAWVHRCLDRWPYPDRRLTEEELLSVPRTVPPGWEFKLFDVPVEELR